MVKTSYHYPLWSKSTAHCFLLTQSDFPQHLTGNWLLNWALDEIVALCLGPQDIFLKSLSYFLHIHVSILFQVLFPFRLLQNIEQSSRYYIVGPCQLSILNIAVCTCQCQTPNLSLPTSPSKSLSSWHHSNWMVKLPFSSLLNCLLICLLSLHSCWVCIFCKLNVLLWDWMPLYYFSFEVSKLTAKSKCLCQPFSTNSHCYGEPLYNWSSVPPWPFRTLKPQTSSPIPRKLTIYLPFSSICLGN